MKDEESAGSSPPEERDVRAGLLALAELIRRLEREGRLMSAIPLLLRKFGDLRQLLFSFEVRSTERLLPTETERERDSRRIVGEALQRCDEMIEEWERGWEPAEEDDGDEG